MKRFGQLVVVAALATPWTASTALAQTTDSPWSVQVDGGAAVGRSSGLSVGGEVDRRLGDSWDVFVELGHMGNITSRFLQDDASNIGTSIGATANPIQKATYYDVGLRYHLRPQGSWNPYILAGFGGARVSTATAFFASGAQLSDSQVTALGVQLGVDLDGAISKAFLVAGAGIRVPLGSRYFFDGSYRYGRVLPRSSIIDGDQGVNAQRVQLGLGIRF